MKNFKIGDFIGQLKIDIPSKEKFFQLSEKTPVISELDEIHEYDSKLTSSEVEEKFADLHSINFERGMLLYGLIAKLKPKSIVEIGTAGGYSTLSMAWALADYNIDGKIYTIDPNPLGKYDEKNSIKNYWENFAPREWTERIEVITGYSGEVLSKKKIPLIDFGYIDGSHVYEAVKHDFFAILKNSSVDFSILFDDYLPNGNDGVAKVINEEIINKFEPTMIETNSKKQRMELQSGDAVEHYMCLIDNNSLKKSLWETYSENEIVVELEKYQALEKRIRLRKKINSKIPLLEKIKFQFWKKV